MASPASEASPDSEASPASEVTLQASEVARLETTRAVEETRADSIQSSAASENFRNFVEPSSVVLCKSCK